MVLQYTKDVKAWLESEGKKMKNFQNVVIGVGKGGKTLAGALAQTGQSVALIERDGGMYGGTCINAARIPTTALEYSARLSNAAGGSFEEKAAVIVRRWREMTT